MSKQLAEFIVLVEVTKLGESQTYKFSAKAECPASGFALCGIKLGLKAAQEFDSECKCDLVKYLIRDLKDDSLHVFRGCDILTVPMTDIEVGFC